MTTVTATDTAVATETARQIGGRAFMMMGTRHKLADGDSLVFDIRGCRIINKIKITLNSMDLYDIEYWHINPRQGKSDMIADSAGLYADMVKADIESNTGLCLSL